MGSCPSLPPIISGRKARERLNRTVIYHRFPQRSEIIAVLSIAVFVCFSWTILNFLNKLSSYILYFTLAEIGIVFAYMMAFAFLESAAITGVLVLLSALLPARWLKNGFAYKGFVILVIATIEALLVQKYLRHEFPSTLMWILGSVGPIVLIAALFAILHSLPKVQNILLKVQDRFLILLFVYVPIGLICLIVVTFRNLL